MAKQKGRRRTPRARDRRRAAQPVFGRRNYILMSIGVLAAVAGFVMMRLENEVDGFLSLYVAPLIILAGYLGVFFAIMASPEPSTTQSDAG